MSLGPKSISSFELLVFGQLSGSAAPLWVRYPSGLNILQHFFHSPIVKYVSSTRVHETGVCFSEFFGGCDILRRSI